MAFNDLKMEVTSRYALQKLHERLAFVTEFAHTFSDLEDRKGASIKIPSFALSAADFNSSTNNYAASDSGVDAATLNLNKHLVAKMGVDDRAFVETEVQFWRDGGVALADAISRGVNDYVVGMINSTNCPLSAAFNPTAKANFTELFKTVYQNEMDIRDTVLALNADMYAKLLSFLDSNVYGSTIAIQNAGDSSMMIRNLYGFAGVACVPNIGTAAGESNIVGALIDKNSLGICSRYLAPQAGAYEEAWKAVDDKSGFTLGFRLYQNRDTGMRNFSCEALCGAGVIRPTGIVRLIND